MRGLPDFKERITTSSNIDYVTRFKAYSDLFNLQSAFKLEDESLWLALYKSAPEVRTTLAISDDDTTLSGWFGRFQRLLQDTPVDKYALFGMTRGHLGIIDALNKFATVHRLPLLAKCGPAATIKDFLLSDNYLSRYYKDANYVLLERLTKLPATTAVDLALEAERSFRLGPAEILTATGAPGAVTGMPAELTGTPMQTASYTGPLVPGAPPFEGQKPFSSRHRTPENLYAMYV